MADCKNMTHPFLTDPGISQRQRLQEDLLSGPAQIDGRSLADLLHFFVQLSSHINYYNENLEISDWKPFFERSLPFTLSGIINYDYAAIDNKLQDLKGAFDKKPSVYGLQLLLNYTYNQYIRPFNQWQLQINGSRLPVEQVINRVIKDKASDAVKNYIKLANTATKWYCTRNFNFNELQENAIWNISVSDVYQQDDSFDHNKTGYRKKLILLYTKIIQAVSVFPGLIRAVAASAGMNLEQSLLPLNEELKQRNSPHLAILFAFLKMFMTLQRDLNTIKKSHLDYFYKQVLQLQPKQSSPDQVHVIVEIQKQLDNYLLKKGTLLKGGKDLNKEEILFSLNDELVINKTQVTDQRTLFLNNTRIQTNTSVLEGVYMAPDATKANGIDKEFKEDLLPSRAALGAKWSKYNDPENKFTYAYPNARLGFVIASPVLLLNEGKRKITITLACKLSDDYCATITDQTGSQDPCCNQMQGKAMTTPVEESIYPPFMPAVDLFTKVNDLIQQTFAYISRPIIAAVVRKGVSKALEKKLTDILTIKHFRPDQAENSGVADNQICYCPREEKRFDKVLLYTEFTTFIGEDQLALIKDFFPPQKAFTVLFSGEKGWIPAPETLSIAITDAASGNHEWNLKIETTLTSDLPAVTFYNAETLKEDLSTTLPLVKIELNDKIKLIESPDLPTNPACCEKPYETDDQPVSLYHFFRNVTLQKETKIDVEVCGLKQLIVQNDESLQNVNSPIFVFGTRPKVDASFYIGSKEMFSKNWKEFYINASWKDRPEKFDVYYQNYAYPGFQFADGSTKITEASFKVEAALLDEGMWKKNGTRQLFDSNPKTGAPFCGHSFGTTEDVYTYDRSLFSGLADYHRPADLQSPLLPLNVSSRYGFIRMTLKGLDFQHDAYPFVLARQMLAYIDAINPADTADLIRNAKESWSLVETLKTRLLSLTTKVSTLSISIPALTTVITTLITDITSLSGAITDLTDLTIKDLSNEWNKLDTNLNHTTNGLDKLIQNITPHINNAVTALGLSSPDVATAKAELAAVTPDLAKINTLMTKINTNFDVIDPLIDDLNALTLKSDVTTIKNETLDVQTKVSAIQALVNSIKTELEKDNPAVTILIAISGDGSFGDPFVFDHIDEFGINRLTKELETRIAFIASKLKADPGLKNGLPKEPYTPVIKSLSIDYTATADANDIDLIHLYPYAGTYKSESLPQQPTLLPTFCDEGSLFLGLKGLVPGSNLNILFQLAEATADSEAPQEYIKWYYLENNTWKLLRKGFELVEDDTNGLTTSGIIRFALPANMTNENTILSKGLHWIKASIPKNSSAVSEIISIHTQAIKATFTNTAENDHSRLATPLPAGSVGKLDQADASVTKITQPYDSFGGKEPEESAHFYVRVSELLRHKNRAIQKFDYERIVLEAFPDLFKAKCINHSYFLNAHQYVKDFTAAPGYVMVAVIPDLNRLKAPASFEPKVPVSLLEKITEALKKITSPFARIKVVNPRYEQVNFCLQVKLVPGRDENYYKEQIRKDLSEFLAPWAVGQFDKLTFGQAINRSDIVRFLEGRDYLDYIIELKMRHADDETNQQPVDQQEVLPLTPRSILVAGNIDICINQGDCAEWTEPGCQNEPFNINNYCTEVIGIKR